LELGGLLERDITELSGGELQRFAVLITLLKDARVYIIDEATNYLDIKHRFVVSELMREIAKGNDGSNYVICVEHDLSVLDYLSDWVCIMYGQASAYGVVTMPMGVREGINAFLDGFIETDNMRFRDESLTFKTKYNLEEELDLTKKSSPTHIQRSPRSLRVELFS
jgi:ATP-binding cassette subfamily E protein 1